MASIPSSPRHSISNVKDLQNLFENPLITYASPSTTPALQYFNMRVTERLHRYRSLKRQWQEVATAAQHDSPLSSKSVSPLPNLDITPAIQEQTAETRIYDFKDYINCTRTKENNSIEFNPLHSRIQTDLIKLRRLIKARQKKFSETIPFKANTNNRSSRETTSGGTTFDDQDNNNNNTTITRKSSSLSRARPLERVKVSGYQMRPSTFPESNSLVNSGIVPISNSSSTCSQYSKQQRLKQQNNNKTFNIYRSRVNPPLPIDSLIQGVPSAKKKPITSSKTIQTTNLKQTLSYRLPMPSILKKKQPSFIKQETLSSLIQPLSINEQATTCLYTYAASSSSATPHYMKLNRETSLLPILLTSSSCVGIRSEEETHVKDPHIYHRNLRDYKQLINRLPKPVVSIIPRYGQDDYGILFEQLDHIRETMPDCNVYDNYRRVC